MNAGEARVRHIATPPPTTRARARAEADEESIPAAPIDGEPADSGQHCIENESESEGGEVVEGQQGVGEKLRGEGGGILISDGGGAAEHSERERDRERVVSMELLRHAQAAAHSTALLLRSPPPPPSSSSSLAERRCSSLSLLSTQAQSLVGASSYAMHALTSHGHGASGCSVSGRGWKSAVEVSAIDAAQSFDYESKRLQELEKRNKLKVGIVGFGNFGQFLAERIIKQGHRVLAYSRTDYSDKAKKLGAAFFRDADDFCEEHPEVVLLCTSILSTEAVLRSLPVQRLKRNTLFVDVLSVKEFPKNLFLQVLPPEFDVLCTHPMFGPESGKNSWAGLPFVYDKVRITGGPRLRRCDKFLDIFASEGCRMVEMSCSEHDKYAAGSQFITHTVGRVLGKLGLESTPINTKGYETLLGLVENTSGDSFELYYGLFMYNPNATEELERLELAFDSIKRQLFGQLHDVLRQQLFGGVNAQNGKLPKPSRESASSNGKSHPSPTTNGTPDVVNNTQTGPPVYEPVLAKIAMLDKDPESISKSLKQQ